MKVRTRTAAAIVAVLGVAIAVLHGATGKSFGFVDPAFTQELFSTTSSFQNSGARLGGVAALPNGDVVAAECVFKGTALHRYSGTLTISKNGQPVHLETVLPSFGGCGLVYHPDGTLYLNMNDGAHGVANVDPSTGAFIRFLGTPGNAVGIAVDPQTNHIVYASKTCVAASTTTCALIDLDTVTTVATNRMVFPVASVAFVNGIYFDPSGAYLFLSNRFPIPRVTVVTRQGVFVQHLDMPLSILSDPTSALLSDPVGIGFHAVSPKFVVTNNTDGSMTRFDFPGDDYTQVPTSSTLAQFGFRGDLMQAGPDGCLYVTQGGARYDNEVISTENSLVRICGGFAPPAGVPTNAPPVAQGALQGTVRDAMTLVPLASAKVLVATGTGVSVLTDASGHYSMPLAPGTYTATGSATNYSSLFISGITVVNATTTTTDFALQPLPGALQGVVTNTVTGAPVRGALIALSGGKSLFKSAITDDDGRYSISSIIPGDYTATISQTYYDTKTATVAIPINATLTANFALTQTPGTIQGTITGNAGPIAGATVTLSNGLLATADAAGHYVFPAVTPGVYSATARAATFADKTTTGISLPSAGSTTVDFTLTPLPGALQGHVTNAAGTAIAGATVTIAGKSGTTDSSGSYKITNITPGMYGITVTATNYDVYTAAGIVIPNATTVTYDVGLTQTPGPISGVVRDTAAKPLPGATVTLLKGSTTVSTTTTDGLGGYTFLSVMPGSYIVTASLATYASNSVNVVLLNASSVTNANITLTPLPGTLSGFVTSTAGQPVASAVVALTGGKTASTDATGFYNIASIAPGTYTATVTASTYNTQTIAGIVIGNAANVTQNFSLMPVPGTLQGVVKDGAGAALVGAAVQLTSGASLVATTMTGAGGAYTFTSVVPGTYGATASMATYNSQSVSGLVIANAGTTTQNFTLVGLPGIVQGVVTSTATGAPLASATVTVSSGASSAPTSTDSTGHYSLSLAPGTYGLSVAAPVYTTVTVPGIVVGNASTTTRNVALTPIPGTLQGVITDTSGILLAGATVTLSTGVSVVTGPNGAYAFSSLPQGTYGITTTDAGYFDASVAGIVVAYGAVVTRNVALTPMPGVLQGAVTNVGGAPIASATVALSGGPSTATDALGRYAFTSLPPGTYSGSVTASNYNSLPVSGIVITHAAATTQNFTLTQTAGTLRGVVTNRSTGAPMQGASVAIAGGANVLTDAAGRYAFRLMPGTYAATANATNFTSDTATGLVVGNAATLIHDFSLAPYVADLSLSASAPAGAIAGGAISYAFTAGNVGSAPAANAVVTHTLAPQTAFSSLVAPLGWTCIKPAAGSGGTVSCSKASMAVGETAAFGITAVIICPYAAPTVTAAALASTSSVEPNTSNNTASFTSTVTTPTPTISGVSVSNNQLWPPNHKMIDVQVNYTVTNLSCSTATTSLSVSGNDGVGPADFKIVDAHHVLLAAERSGAGAGRTYVITITARNDTKTVTSTVTVSVAHDQGAAK